MLISAYSALVTVFFRFVAPLIGRTRTGRRRCLAARSRLPEPIAAVPDEGTVWVHGASLGECKLLVRVLEILRRRHPDDYYVATAVTDSGVDFLRAHGQQRVIAAGHLPYDSVGMMNRMIAHFRVKRLWLLETELWPGLLTACARRGVPVGVLNGRLELRSLHGYRLFGRWLRPLFAHVAPVLAQSAEYAERFRQAGFRPEALRVTGNLKSRVPVRAPEPQERGRIRAALGIGGQEHVLTAGCLHPGEAGVLRDALRRLAAAGEACRCIVVPRHREAVPALAAELGGEALVLPEPRTQEPWRVCVIDRYGILEDMYAAGDAALVGGTFVAVGGHNLWDAAQWGIPVIVGPDCHGQKESLARLRDAGVARQVADAEALAFAVRQVLGPDREQVRQAAARLADSVGREEDSILASLP